VLDLQVATASSLTPEQRRSSHLVLFGLPGVNPVIQEVAASLPLRLDASGRVVEGDTGVLAGVRDTVTLGILQTVPSPFNSQRAVLVVTGTNPDGLALAVRGLRQGGLRGNLATIQAPESEASFLRIRTFDIPMARLQVTPTATIEETVPSILTAVVAGGAVALLALTGYTLLRAARRRAGEAGDVADGDELVDDWMEGMDRGQARAVTRPLRKL
jgi:hypothetical protein